MDKYYFSFNFEDASGDNSGPYAEKRWLTKTVEYPDDISWTSPLLDFVDMLSEVYGYDISQKIRFLDKSGVISLCPRASEFIVKKSDIIAKEKDTHCKGKQ